MKRYDAGPVMAGLKDFQRATVAHVIDRYFGTEPTRRFLVADETGLGKSVVARGVIAQTLQRLQDDTSVERVDVIYVCSNQDVARQNIGRLRVTPDETVTLSSRLTLLAKHAHQLNAATVAAGKPINLVAFTPGTSFDQGWRTGTAEERALLFLLLEQANSWDGWRTRAALRALQAGVANPERFKRHCDRLREQLEGKLDPTITGEFLRRARQRGLLDEFDALLDGIGRRPALPNALQEKARKLTGDLRTALATAGVEVLEPDLIILDEFQRFRELLDPNGGEGAELARHLFDYRAARVLLLSATPYKPFTFAEEIAAGEDHYSDFRQVLRFLSDDESWHADVTKAFEGYRDALVRGEPCGDLRDWLRGLLLRVMCRTERPALGQDGMLREHVSLANDVDAADVRSYVSMRRIAKAVGAPMTVEYWKSAPYFLNFLDGYQLGDKVRAALDGQPHPDVPALLASAHLLDAKVISRREPVDLGNGRLRQLAAGTVDRGWWRLLWLPPSLPYHALGEPFAAAAREGITKRLLFSSWNATPTAVAGLLSYEAERRLGRAGEGHRHLDYRMEHGRPAAMNALALFWPHPALAALCDPLALARQRPDETAPLDEFEREVRERLRARTSGDAAPTELSPAEPWELVFQWPDADPGVEDAAAALGTSADEEGAATGLDRHVARARELASQARYPTAEHLDRLLDSVAAIGLHGPGNIAWRALSRLIHTDSTVTPAGHWRAAALLANGLRSLFNRPESAQLLESLSMGQVYWQAVLRYCAAGGLQAVLDEHLHTLRSGASDTRLDDDELYRLAEEARQAIASRPSTYEAFDPRHPGQPIKLPGRFALRYGGRGEEQSQVNRKETVRRAFNSPFWPFVVATTSAGQEGIDFHQWCSAVVHWNTPANPVDFEQREGRVHRFGGHAVRRNVAAAHRTEALRSPEPDVWKALYDAARAVSGELGDFAPYWVFPGPAKIERHILPYPLSRDQAKLDRLKSDLVMYRLAFGQPRQEDLLNLLRRRETGAAGVPDILDLRPAPEWKRQ
ncbi:helicase-related protein [Micromonospora sp. 4G57]|uniref:Helicase-related protein n=1 Tax=Micromonospora sicca TaxID=2202420 RepID=A0ABU5JJU3_9ACTN|nr:MULTISPECIES: helicase-related protein [unclassified Micromonospora]MDZ5446070.1 helicase-related protein [Micromonospora sp. 4G57]MDZ5492797.1 helicase-related protein [Micromonospora sp. 4G53]